MLEVGLVEGPLSWNRAHFGGWAVSSSPLVLGADLSDSALLSKIAPRMLNTRGVSSFNDLNTKFNNARIFIT